MHRLYQPEGESSMSMNIPRLRQEHERMTRKLAKAQEYNGLNMLRIFELEKELEATKVRANAAFSMYSGILMRAGTISEARRWTATIYAELVEITKQSHTQQDILDLFDRNGISMEIEFFETGVEDESGMIYNMKEVTK
jgi:hypothetical protein